MSNILNIGVVNIIGIPPDEMESLNEAFKCLYFTSNSDIHKFNCLTEKLINVDELHEYNNLISGNRKIFMSGLPIFRHYYKLNGDYGCDVYDVNEPKSYKDLTEFKNIIENITTNICIYHIHNQINEVTGENNLLVRWVKLRENSYDTNGNLIFTYYITEYNRKIEMSNIIIK